MREREMSTVHELEGLVLRHSLPPVLQRLGSEALTHVSGVFQAYQAEDSGRGRHVGSGFS